MSVVKLTQIGNSVGVILPKDVLARMNVEKGDRLFMSEAANGITLSAYDPEFESQVLPVRDIMKKRRAVLRELAK